MPKHRRVDRPLRFALLLISLLLAVPVSSAAKGGVVLECPPILATSVIAEKYRGWLVYSNDPLRLSGADILYVVDHEEGALDPDEVSQLDDEDLSVVHTFRLVEHRDIARPALVCHYGVHAQLSRELPPGAVECKVVQHRRYGPREFEFEASCR